MNLVLFRILYSSLSLTKMTPTSGKRSECAILLSSVWSHSNERQTSVCLSRESCKNRTCNQCAIFMIFNGVNSRFWWYIAVTFYCLKNFAKNSFLYWKKKNLRHLFMAYFLGKKTTKFSKWERERYFQDDIVCFIFLVCLHFYIFKSTFWKKRMVIQVFFT